MLKWDPNKHAFVFDKGIGGYGYMLRANQTVVRSSWPGMVAGYELWSMFVLIFDCDFITNSVVI